MSEKTVQISSDIEPTDVRFSMRSLLVATLLSGIAAAVIAPSFRLIQAENIGLAAALWGLFFSLAILRTIRFARQRFQLEMTAGGLLVASQWRGTYTGHGWTCASFIVGLILIAMGIACIVVGHEIVNSNTGGKEIPIVLSGVFAGYCVSNGIALIWWHRTAQFRENGFFYGLRLMPWAQVDSATLTHGMLKLRGTDTRKADFYLIMHVPASQIEAIRAVLAAKLPTLLSAEFPFTKENFGDDGREEETTNLVPK
jgi:hypothetical protein